MTYGLHPRLALLLGMLLLATCSDSRIEVRVTGLNPDIRSLLVAVALRDHPERKIRQPVSGRLDSFLVSATDAPDELSLVVGGLDINGCRTHEGRLSAALPTAGPLTVALSQLKTPGCRITVEPIGDGQGQVVSEPPGILCPGKCAATFAPGTSVQLRASAKDEQSYFTGWSQSCSGFGTCVLTTNDDTQPVRAGFLPSRVCQGGFCWEAPLPQGSALRALWARSPNDVWAVGDGGVVLRWFGSFWAPEHSGTLRNLYAIWGRGDELWMGGDGGIILHWDGAALSTIASSTTERLRAIAGGASEVLIVGDNGTLLRWNGSDMAQIPNVPRVHLHAVAYSLGTYWIVGENGTVLVWNGRQIQTVATNTSSALHSVIILPSGEVVIAGDKGTILRGKGFSLNEEKTQPIANLNALWDGAGGALWAAGEGGALSRFDGTSWTSASGGTLQDLLALSGSDATTAWAAGAAGSILRWNGGQWVPQRIVDTEPLIAVGEYDPAHVLAVSPSGRVQQRVQGLWHTIDPGPGLPLNDAWVGRGEIWGAGPGGAVMQWAAVPPATQERWFVLLVSSNHMRAVYRRSFDPIGGQNDVWAVGDGGEIWQIVGPQYAPYLAGRLATTSTQSLRSIVWLSSNEGWAVGDAGTTLHLLGTTAKLEPSGTSERLLRVFGSRTDDVWAVGENGAVVHWNGTAWSKLASGTASALRTGWVGSASNVWFAGDAGTLLTWDGSRFTARAIGSTTNLLAMGSSSDATLYLVGENGTILSGQ